MVNTVEHHFSGVECKRLLSRLNLESVQQRIESIVGRKMELCQYELRFSIGDLGTLLVIDYYCVGNPYDHVSFWTNFKYCDINLTLEGSKPKYFELPESERSSSEEARLMVEKMVEERKQAKNLC